jgi:hypothetical protein
MKYSLKMTEVEYLATVSVVGDLLGKLFNTPVSVRKEKDVEVVYKEKEREKGDEPDNDDKRSEVVSDYVVEWGSLDADVPAWLKHEEPPTGEQVGRGPVNTIAPPKEDTLPPVVAPVAEAQVARMNGKLLARGREVFNGLVGLWLEGYKQEGASQPDRAEAVRVIANGRNSYKVLTYVKAVGGLTHAVNGALEEWSSGTEEERQALVLDVAGNITQVSSILFPDLSDLYEYKNIFQSEDNDDE